MTIKCKVQKTYLELGPELQVCPFQVSAHLPELMLALLLLVPVSHLEEYNQKVLLVWQWPAQDLVTWSFSLQMGGQVPRSVIALASALTSKLWGQKGVLVLLLFYFS